MDETKDMSVSRWRGRVSIGLLMGVLTVSSAWAQSSVKGTWDAAFQLNVDGVHGAVLPSGKVLYVPHRISENGLTESVVFDPSSPGSAKYVTVPANYFCGGHTRLADGKLLFMGGEDEIEGSLRKAGYFDYQTETWTEIGSMNRRRWYPSAIQLGDGSVIVFGGQTSPADVGSNDDTIEFYDPGSGLWAMAGGQNIPGQYEEAYNRVHLMPDGRIFQSGHLPDSYYYDPVAGTWTLVDRTELGKARGNSASVRLQDGRIFIIGGDNEIAKEIYRSAEVIDLTQPTPRWQSAASMTTARSFIDAVVLPDGNVLVVGGDESSGSRSLVPELYDPATNSWSDMAPFTIERGYHSTTLLLPDGRVIVSGGEGHQGTGHGTGHFGESAKFEIWNPYYLFSTARPQIQSLPSVAGYGQTVSMGYSSERPVSHAVIYRGGSQTHSFSYNQISEPVALAGVGGGSATFTIPSNPNVLPPNFYMVFLMSADGVPSVARWIQIGTVTTDIFADGFESGTTASWSSVLGAS